MIHGVIMAGGSGTRFWPQSRRNRPKQLLDIAGRRTMIRATIERIIPVIPYDRITVVAGISHVEEIKKQVPELADTQVIAEPFGRNTAGHSWPPSSIQTRYNEAVLGKNDESYGRI